MTNRITSLAVFALLIGTVVVGCSESALTGDIAAKKPQEAIVNSNGAPSGPHYNLNIIGVPRDKTADMTGANGHVIFLKLGSKDEPANGQKILLQEGDDFRVLDANGTDGEAAFQLPNPDPDCDGETDYSVYVRALGNPGGEAKIETCYTAEYDGVMETYCATDYDGGVAEVTVTRGHGKQTFENVSKDLLYVDFCLVYDAYTDECVEWTIIPLFGRDVEEFFWEYDNAGLKLAQMRFYQEPTVAWDESQVDCTTPVDIIDTTPQ